MRYLEAILVLGGVFLAPAAADAQIWSVDVYAGRATYSDLAPALGTTNAVLGLRYTGGNGGWFYASAAAPFGAANPFWGAAGLGRRFIAQLGPVGLGVDGAGHGFTFYNPDSASLGSGGTLVGMPVVTLGLGATRLELRSGARHYTVGHLGVRHSRTLHESDARVILRPTATVEVQAEVRHARAEEDAYSFAGGTAAAGLGQVDVWASAGRWLNDALPDMVWSAGARVALGNRFDVWGSVQQDGTDPLYWNAPRQNWSLGVSRSFGGPVWRPGQIVAPTAVPSTAGVTFSVPAAEVAEAPSVAGDFNGWQAVPMRRSGDVWSVTMPVPRGAHHYAFQRADGSWFLPSSVIARLDDGFGGVSALLVVE